MSALRLTKLSPSHRANQIDFCHNRCFANNGKNGGRHLGYSVATHVAWMLDRPTLLCTRCSRSWPAAYNSALDFPEAL